MHVTNRAQEKCRVTRDALVTACVSNGVTRNNTSMEDFNKKTEKHVIGSVKTR